QFNEEKKEALKNADRTDANTTMTENIVSENINQNIQSISLQQVSDSYSYNNAQKQLDSQKSAMLTSQAQSGTRTSSMNDAINIETANNAEQMQFQQDSQRINYNYQINSILNNLAQNTFNIQNNRTDAMELRNSYKGPTFSSQEQINFNDLFTGNIFKNIATAFSDPYAGAGSAYKEYMMKRKSISQKADWQIKDLNNAATDIMDNRGWRFLGRLFSGNGVNTTSQYYNLFKDL
ncbi:MAG: hypothetical protein HUJ68_04510, partial [Clostridia bacterium]|nr:hypothetical protein [Clostridia bacterium]